jgi:hypothetical protein
MTDVNQKVEAQTEEPVPVQLQLQDIAMYVLSGVLLKARKWKPLALCETG